MLATDSTATAVGDAPRIKRYDEQPKLVEFGRGGSTVHFSRNHYQSGYDTRESFFKPSKWWAHNYEEIRDASQLEGVPFVDKIAAVETDAGFRYAIRGPMVNVDLAAGEIDACPKPSELMSGAMMSDPGNQFGHLLALHTVEKARNVTAGPLDCVSIPDYIAGWKAHGATIGIIRNGQFIEA